MKDNVIVQRGSMVVSILLALTFFILLIIGLIGPENIINSLILIIIAIICLAIFSAVIRIEHLLSKGRR